MKQNTMAASATGALVLERLPQVKARTGLSRTEIYRRIAADPPRFPAQIKLGGRTSAWDAAEIDAWIAGHIAKRDARASA